MYNPMIWLTIVACVVSLTVLYLVFVEDRIQNLGREYISHTINDDACSCEDYGNCGCQCDNGPLSPPANDNEYLGTGLDTYIPPLTVAEAEILLADAKERYTISCGCIGYTRDRGKYLGDWERYFGSFEEIDRGR